MANPAPGTRISILCGVLMLACALLASVAPLAEPAWTRRVTGFVIFAAGLAELVVALAGPGIERGATDMVLGLLSLAVGLVLLVVREGDALWLAALLGVWLLARGATELLGGLASGAVVGVAAARLFRGSADLILGLLAVIGALASIFAEILVGWPATIVRMILLLVAASLMASGSLHIWLALAVSHGRLR